MAPVLLAKLSPVVISIDPVESVELGEAKVIDPLDAAADDPLLRRTAPPAAAVDEPPDTVTTPPTATPTAPIPPAMETDPDPSASP